ncbi:unnamed protein product [Clonostachys rosea]|uniref:Inner centromere protein ARK-binding domain-containing protein n=1 Tax=Bionectria ochroleuca TaxID=29856 RepID=A0ABY6UBK4_BIOOC|nr:unnamed protein product [Clonostachys rosea]
MAMRGPRLQVGSGPWVAEERSCALNIAQSEVEEFSYSVRNEYDWLNEHMAGIFNENEINIAETFKTPGKLRGKTPYTARKANPLEARVPLSNVFASTPNGATNRFTQQLTLAQSPKHPISPVRESPSPAKSVNRTHAVPSPKPIRMGPESQDSGYYGSQELVEQGTSLRESFPSNQMADVIHETTTVASPEVSPAPTALLPSPKKPLQVEDERATSEEAVAQEPEAHEETDEDGDNVAMSSPVMAVEASLKANLESAEEDAVAFPEDDMEGVDPTDGARSVSDGSSPIRPMVRKSSLNFAPLPAREPLAAGKTTGHRASRVSHLDDNRMSYYNRSAGEKSLGSQAWREMQEEEHHGDMDIDKQGAQPVEEKANAVLSHNRTYTQRLQDQINKLGKTTGGSRPSKSIPNLANVQVTTQSSEPPRSPSLKHISPTKSTPGAFPEDDDDWIDPPSPAQAPVTETLTRPELLKSHTADVMEGIYTQGTSTDIQQDSPAKTAASSSHAKSASVSAVSQQLQEQTIPLMKAPSISKSMRVPSPSPSQSPSRGFRGSPLKQVKDKLSSILKNSSRILASSAAASAEGKSALLSPSRSRLALHLTPSQTSLRKPSNETLKSADTQSIQKEATTAGPAPRRTRASTEKEKEEKRREKETKVMEDQIDKLEKARAKEREKARVFSKEQEKIANMERQVSNQKGDKAAEPARPTRTSPRKPKEHQEESTNVIDQDVEMTDTQTPAPRPASQASRAREAKRPVKPTAPAKVKQAPTVIRVNTGSQNSQFHPSTAGNSANGNESLLSSVSQTQQASLSKASKASVQSKPSAQNTRAPASASKPKAAELAAKRKEQEERDAQRKREAKAEAERKRVATQEEQRKQEQRRQEARQEAERQRQKDREQAAAQAESRQNAQRQAMIEKAKQTRAPPPAVRSQPNGPPDFSALSQERKADGPARPPSRMNSGIYRNYEESGRPVNAVLSNASKAGLKRPMGHDEAQPPRPQSRAGPSYQAKDAKRRRTSQDHDELGSDDQPNIKGPPVRPSAGFKKEPAKKSVFQSGYTSTQGSVTRDLFKATVTAQHNSATKAAHPLDMAQISKGAIPFAPNPNPAGSHKTPARPAGGKSIPKSAQRSSPRFQNGDSIELPEIQTDDESDSDNDAGGIVAAWADSPDLRRALMRQETMDPSQIFGPPAPLNMEEVFHKSKDKFHKFRARTSSANWSGVDRLTEEDIRKDLAARDKLRREGGWSYEMSKDMI